MTEAATAERKPDAPEAPKPEPVKPRPTFDAGAEPLPIIPRNLNEVALWADAIIKAEMVPASYEIDPAHFKVADFADEDDWRQNRHGRARDMTKARLMIGIEKGLEVGMGPITALSTIMIVNNRPCIWGDGAVALCQQKGKVDWVKTSYEGDENTEAWTAVFEIKRVRQEVPYRATFSVKDAKRAGLWLNAKRDPWMKYPQRMLLARARAYALREGFADCLMGLGIAEEIADLPPAPTPAARTDKSFLDDAPSLAGPAKPAIEHKPEQNIAPVSTAASSSVAQEGVAVAAEPKPVGQPAQAEPGSVAAGGGKEASPPSAGPSITDDWKMIGSELAVNAGAAKNLRELQDVSHEAARVLKDAPQEIVETVNAAIQERRKRLVK